MNSLFSVFKYFKKYKRLFLSGVLFIFISNYFRVISPQLTGHIIDLAVSRLSNSGSSYANWDTGPSAGLSFLFHLISDTNFRNVMLYACGLLFLFAILSGIFMFLMRQTLIVMSRHIEYDQKNEIYQHYQKLDIDFFKSHSLGDLMNRISEDVSRVRMFTGPSIMYLINLAFVIGMSLYFMFSIDAKLAWIALSPLPILSLIIYLVNKMIHKKSELIQNQLGKITSVAQESFAGIRLIKSYAQERSVSGLFFDQSKIYRKHALSLARTEAIYFPGIGLMIGLSTILTVLVGGLDVIHHVPGASVGKITAFVLYIQILTFPVSAIGYTISMMQRAAVSQKRIDEFLATPPAISDVSVPQPLNTMDTISIQNLTYQYPNTGILACDQINMEIQKGAKVAIIGKTGSGKTTLAMLLLRFFESDSGMILYGTIPIQKIRIADLRAAIGYVQQDVFLFSDTIRNNILLGAPNASQEEMELAAKKAGIYNEIMQFPLKFETIIGERGVTLSGGQKQRLSIARALIKNPSLLVFDDCLSAVDTQTEQWISRQLSEHLDDKTLILITHRIPESMTFDRIFVLESGKITESGTHDELMNKRGYYYEILQKQRFTDNS